MIYTDALGYLTNKTLDVMDSAMRAGVFATCRANSSNILLTYEEPIATGLLVRHPFHVPSNNPHNFTRDQMMPLVAGLYTIDTEHTTNLIRRVFWQTLKRFCFAQNTQRDVKGSRKMKRPHSFYKDPRPNTDTLTMKFSFKTWKWESQLV